MMNQIDDWRQAQLDEARAAGFEGVYSVNGGLSFAEWLAWRRTIAAADGQPKAAQDRAGDKRRRCDDFATRFRTAYRRRKLSGNENSEPTSTALHEAGHGVVARKLGLECARIVMREGGGGFASIEPLADVVARLGQIDGVRRYAISVWAGAAASLDGEPSKIDRDLIAAGGDAAGIPVAERTAWRDAAVRLVAQHRGAIERVARALEQQRELSQCEIDCLIDDHQAPSSARSGGAE